MSATCSPQQNLRQQCLLPRKLCTAVRCYGTSETGASIICGFASSITSQDLPHMCTQRKGWRLLVLGGSWLRAHDFHAWISNGPVGEGLLSVFVRFCALFSFAHISVSVSLLGIWGRGCSTPLTTDSDWCQTHTETFIDTIDYSWSIGTPKRFTRFFKSLLKLICVFKVLFVRTTYVKRFRGYCVFSNRLVPKLDRT